MALIVARLWDVAPDGESQPLVGRGSFRPRRQGADAWYLHPAVWRFRPGHTLKLELLGGDPPYSRPSNGTFRIELSDPRVRLPARSRRR